ncbi:hypothetical protein ACFQUX_26025 [Pantoea stewartii]|uniref:Uncharacterized protein n=1 Tax=Pantoea stewartii subsp. stewartii DC283 TaxID=660596 RepID=H3RC15_PANSE|nr:hypothetical protein CKS_4278 [Pantoea stewartii subsp. stewartii DC283]
MSFSFWWLLNNAVVPPVPVPHMPDDFFGVVFEVIGFCSFGEQKAAEFVAHISVSVSGHCWPHPG